jgi:hypothetical protein
VLSGHDLTLNIGEVDLQQLLYLQVADLVAVHGGHLHNVDHRGAHQQLVISCRAIITK